MDTIIRAGRTFVALCKAGRSTRPSSPLYHAVTPGCRMALCSEEPGAGSDWAKPPGERVTCLVCLRRLARLGGDEQHRRG